jgi:hypothetical protein
VKKLKSKLKKTIDCKFGGYLEAGVHTSDEGRACALEAYSVVLGEDWTDDPRRLGIWDIRYLNDMEGVGPEEKTDRMIDLVVAYRKSASWGTEKGQKMVDDILLRMVRKVFYPTRVDPVGVFQKYRDASTVEELRFLVRSRSHHLSPLNQIIIGHKSPPGIRIATILREVKNLPCLGRRYLKDGYRSSGYHRSMSPAVIFCRAVDVLLKSERKNRGFGV